MKLWRTLVAATALLLIAAANTYSVEWAALEQAWSAYLTSPAPATATKVVALLPPGRRASHKAPDFDVQAAIQILNRLGELQSMVVTGSPHAFEVAFALREISDGSYSEWLSEMLGASIRAHPRTLLASFDSNQARASVSCRFAAAADPDRFNTPEKYAAEIKARRSALAAVSRPETNEHAACLIEELDRALSR